MSAPRSTPTRCRSTPAPVRVSRRAASTPVTRAITAGDDYELLLAVRPRAHRRLSAAAHLAGAVLTRIGRCQREPDVILHRSAGAAVERAPLPQGYSHFRPVDALRGVPSDVEGR